MLGLHLLLPQDALHVLLQLPPGPGKGGVIYSHRQAGLRPLGPLALLVEQATAGNPNSLS